MRFVCEILKLPLTEWRAIADKRHIGIRKLLPPVLYDGSDDASHNHNHHNYDYRGLHLFALLCPIFRQLTRAILPDGCF